MQVHRNEITTGLLFLLTAGLVTGIVLSLTNPGLFRQLKNFTIYFDSAAGVKPGASVLLAGRKIGQVTQIYSPVPEQDRPEGHQNYEVKIVVQVDNSADVYSDARASMQQLGMLGEQVIDFAGGTQNSGEAPPDAKFVGVRVPTLNDALPKMLELIEPVAHKATLTLNELQQAAGNLNQMMDKGSDLRVAIEQIKELAANLRELTSPESSLNAAIVNLKEMLAADGPVNKALQNIEKLTSDLIKDDDIRKTLDNVRNASKELNETLQEVNALVESVKPTLDQTLVNTEQMTDTLKRQPWRLVWPATKKYPADQPPEPKKEQKPEITIRKSRTEFKR